MDSAVDTSSHRLDHGPSSERGLGHHNIFNEKIFPEVVIDGVVQETIILPDINPFWVYNEVPSIQESGTSSIQRHKQKVIENPFEFCEIFQSQQDLKYLPRITYIPRFIQRDQANQYYERLLGEIPWHRDIPKDQIDPSRRTKFYYENLRNRFGEKVIVLDEIAKEIEQTFDTTVQGISCDLYLTGKAHQPWYSDRKSTSHTFYLTFGVGRDFSFKHIETAKTKKYALGEGDLIYFDKRINKKYKYWVPKRTQVIKPHIVIILLTKKPFQSPGGRILKDVPSVLVMLGGNFDPKLIKDIIDSHNIIKLIKID